MFRSLILAAVLLASAPLIATAGEITLLPSVKLQIGDRDDYGRYWDGGYWRDRDYWHRHYEWRGDRWWKHDNGRHAAGIKTAPMSAVTVKAGTIVTTVAAAGVAAKVMVTAIITNQKGASTAPFFVKDPARFPLTTTGSAQRPPPRWPTRFVSPALS